MKIKSYSTSFDDVNNQSWNIDPENLVDHTPMNSWFFWKNNQGIYLGCNNNMAKKLGLSSREEIVGLSDFDLPFLKSEAIIYQKEDKQISQSGISRQFNKIVSIKKEKNYLQIIKIPLIKNDKIYGVLGSGVYYHTKNSLNNLFKTNKITDREFEIMRYLVRGKTAKEISTIKKLSRRTIEFYLEKIKQKMNVSSKSELIDKIFDYFI